MPLFKDQLTAEIQALRLNAGKKSELLSLLDRAIQEETQKWRKGTFSVTREVYEKDEPLCHALEQAIWVSKSINISVFTEIFIIYHNTVSH